MPFVDPPCSDSCFSEFPVGTLSKSMALLVLVPCIFLLVGVSAGNKPLPPALCLLTLLPYNVPRYRCCRRADPLLQRPHLLPKPFQPLLDPALLDGSGDESQPHGVWRQPQNIIDRLYERVKEIEPKLSPILVRVPYFLSPVCLLGCLLVVLSLLTEGRSVGLPAYHRNYAREPPSEPAGSVLSRRRR
jgi:hypothetical protein